MSKKSTKPDQDVSTAQVKNREHLTALNARDAREFANEALTNDGEPPQVMNTLAPPDAPPPTPPPKRPTG